MEKKVDPLEDPNLMPSQAFTTAAALLDVVDRRVVVSLRDGRKLFGVLRSFDQFANLVLQDTVERIYDLPNGSYGEQRRGVYIVRGENVAWVGEIDMDKEDMIEEAKVPGVATSALKEVPFAEIEKAHNDRVSALKKKDKQMAKKLLRNGFLPEYFGDNLY
ncbi:sm-like protein LSm1 [Trichomonascus vanleenenianus]|uniref:Lsm1p n=1 Tax=Trichomonascus vanleenenianus TaxID=2268995 RepID=UPI003ECA6951